MVGPDTLSGVVGTSKVSGSFKQTSRNYTKLVRETKRTFHKAIVEQIEEGSAVPYKLLKSTKAVPRDQATLISGIGVNRVKIEKVIKCNLASSRSSRCWRRY